MESLQIQDAFAPYYVDRPAKADKTAKRKEAGILTVHASGHPDSGWRPAATSSARAIAAAEAERR